jgi:hypothetical protein
MCCESCSEQAVHVGTWDCQGVGLGAASDRTEIDSSELHFFSSSAQYSNYILAFLSYYQLYWANLDFPRRPMGTKDSHGQRLICVDASSRFSNVNSFAYSSPGKTCRIPACLTGRIVLS